MIINPITLRGSLTFIHVRFITIRYMIIATRKHFLSAYIHTTAFNSTLWSC